MLYSKLMIHFQIIFQSGTILLPVVTYSLTIEFARLSEANCESFKHRLPLRLSSMFQQIAVNSNQFFDLSFNRSRTPCRVRTFDVSSTNKNSLSKGRGNSHKNTIYVHDSTQVPRLLARFALRCSSALSAIAAKVEPHAVNLDARAIIDLAHRFVHLAQFVQFVSHTLNRCRWPAPTNASPNKHGFKSGSNTILLTGKTSKAGVVDGVGAVERSTPASLFAISNHLKPLPVCLLRVFGKNGANINGTPVKRVRWSDVSKLVTLCSARVNELYEGLPAKWRSW